ncbi:SufD family Fe-S cluster assembly protein [Sulfurospirillum arcachonense]|uniref:SufD family Fe-S cluster assembly protein n=1 Tax=Sulfurospirillum arcachonense TaxID=57666 RepID=UPI00046860F0|nr:SufD family Fe-S cluster assembly protein [Sulfurospirillum arcachonense]
MKLIEINAFTKANILKKFSLPYNDLTNVRIDSIEKFQTLGLPTRKSELFSKTGIRAIYEKEYLEEQVSGFYTELKSTDNYRIVFRKGFYSPFQSNLPKGITIKFDKEPTLDKLSSNPFYYLSGALNKNFYEIKVEKGFHVETPLEIIYLDDLYKSQTHMYITLKLEENSRLNLYEKVLINAETFFNHTLNVVLEKDSKLVHVHEQKSQDNTHIINTYNYTQNENSSSKIYSYQDGANLAIALWNVDLAGENANVDFTALQLPTNKQKLNTLVNIQHNAPNTTSNQLIKQIINDEAKGLVDAKVIAGHNAPGTKANQLCNSLLLSKKASAQSYVKPQLKIFIDELEASHGATVGSLSEEELYYLMSRGITKENARLMLIDAFKKDAYERFPTWAKEDLDEYQ